MKFLIFDINFKIIRKQLPTGRTGRNSDQFCHHCVIVQFYVKLLFIYIPNFGDQLKIFAMNKSTSETRKVWDSLKLCLDEIRLSPKIRVCSATFSEQSLYRIKSHYEEFFHQKT
jgi:hypothetical protein